jgi:hypothetical protein
MNFDWRISSIERRQQRRKIPAVLERHAIIRSGALEILRLPETDSDDSPVYVGILYASKAFRDIRRSCFARSFYYELAEVYREIYGVAPWNEYLMCSDQRCIGKRSIFDVYGSEIESQFCLRDLEKKDPIRASEYACPECGSPMTLYHPLDTIISMIEREFSDEFVAVFLFNREGNIAGFTWAWFGDEDAIAKKLSNQLKCSLDSPAVTTTKEYIRKLPSKRALFFNEWAVSRPYRNTYFSICLLKQLALLGRKQASLAGNFDPQFLGTSLEGSNSCSVYRKLGADTIYRDPRTDIVILAVSVNYSLRRYERVEDILRRKRLLHKKKNAA